MAEKYLKNCENPIFHYNFVTFLFYNINIISRGGENIGKNSHR